MSNMKLKIILGAVFIVTFLLILVFIKLLNKIRNFSKDTEIKEPPDFVLENIKKSLSERNLVKEELKKSEGMSSIILNNIDLGIGIFDEFKVLKTANPMFYKMFSLKEDFLNKSITLLKNSNNIFYNLVKELRYDYGNKTFFKLLKFNDFVYEIRVFSVKEDDFGLKGFLIISNDITEIEKTKKQLELKERLEVMGEMSAGIAHEFKNSLSTLKGYSQMIEDKAQEDYVKKYASKILKEVDDINSVVNSFLLYAKPIHPEITVIDGSYIKEAIETNFREKIQFIKFEIDEKIQFKTDAVLFKQCVVNIVKNAFESVETLTPLIEISLKKIENNIKLIVKDNGKGISDEAISKVFIPFFTTKKKGTGLGLSLCEKIVSELNGKISVKSDNGIGTKVVIEL